MEYVSKKYFGESKEEGMEGNEGGKGKAYQTFFNNKLKAYNVDSPTKLSDDEKKKFFASIEAEWKGEAE
ncbi:MAG: hypothetical protein KAS32_31145 [Candidatus Peribacteraceae bacterium]|nr:hypothetical protein [Candidatus Peribacteraceae bacterium]